MTQLRPTDQAKRERIAQLEREIANAPTTWYNMTLCGCSPDEMRGFDDYIRECEQELKELQDDTRAI
jgi:hypothetical protein